MRRRPAGRACLAVTAAVLVGISCSGDDGADEPLSDEAFCEELVAVQPLDDQLGRIETSELTSTYDDLTALTPQAPTAIGPAMDTLTDYVGVVVDALADVEPGNERAARDALRDLDGADLADVEAAATEVEMYAADVCGLDLETGTTTPPTTGPPATGPPATDPPSTDPVTAPPTT